ncbi:MAG: HlyD family secretion protein [Rubripirellula sp.]
MTQSVYSPPQPSNEDSESMAQPQADPPERWTIGSISSGLLFNLILPLILLAAGVAVVLMLGSAEPETRPPADNTRAGRLRALPSVRIEQLRSLESTEQKLHLVVDGSVVPFREARVAAEVAGRIVFKSDLCEAGTYVKKGELLMQIDPTDYELERDRLQRMQEQEYQSLMEADQEKVNTERLIAVAKDDFALQQKEVERQNQLSNGFTSRAEIDQAQRALLGAQQQLVNLENQVSLLEKKRVRLEASEKLAATQLRAAEINLKRTDIQAPIDGVIVSEDADLNTFVARGSGLVTIDDTSKVEVATSLRMDQLYWVLDQPGVEADESPRGYALPETEAIIEYELAGREGVKYHWSGRLLSYDGIGLDPDTRTVPVRVVVDNPAEYVDEHGTTKKVTGATALVRGMFVRVNLLIKPQSPLVVIPANALQPGNRVLQFISDPSVLDSKPEEGQDEGLAATTGDSEDAEIESNFDPNDWEPGRVFIRHRVNPVDSLSVANAVSDASVDGTSIVEADAQRLWVCEVRDSSLNSNSFVVVSPLGSFDDASLPARAKKLDDMKNPKAAKADTDASDEQTLVSQEDA